MRLEAPTVLGGDRSINLLQKLYVNLGLIVSKRDLVQHWGSTTLQMHKECLCTMKWSMAAKRVGYTARGCPVKFEKIWIGWMTQYELK